MIWRVERSAEIYFNFITVGENSCHSWEYTKIKIAYSFSCTTLLKVKALKLNVYSI